LYFSNKVVKIYHHCSEIVIKVNEYPPPAHARYTFAPQPKREQQNERKSLPGLSKSVILFTESAYDQHVLSFKTEKRILLKIGECSAV
jgi:hypothetical protein